MQKAPELLVSELLMKEKELKKEKKQNKVAGWFTEKIEEKASKQEFKDKEEMVQWRSINHEGVNDVRKNCREMVEEVLGRYKVEVSKRGWNIF